MDEKADSRERAGGRGASRLEATYRRHAGRVYTLCLRLLAGVAVAEDATVRVFVRLGPELTGRWDESRTPGRLREIAIEEALALLRVGVLKDVPPDITPQARSGDGSPPRLDQAKLDALAARLTDRLRVVFVLHDQEGLSDRAIAAHLHVDEPEVRRLVRAARSELRRLWLGET